jgi:DMSO/TMAO reductase YedYZ molybdopterin-dependent catalytic subunit
MSTVSRGFKGRRRPSVELPPGQYLVEDFPVLSAGPTPSIDHQDWELVITSETDEQRRWDWAGFRALPTEQVTVDLHCVTHWSKLGTVWEGVSLDTLLDGLNTSAGFALVTSWGGYTANLPLEDLVDGKAWIAFRYDGAELEAEHGGPARLLVPTCICGRAPSGCAGSSCWTPTSRASGRAWAITTTATPGRSSGSGATEREAAMASSKRWSDGSALAGPVARPLPSRSVHRRRALHRVWPHHPRWPRCGCSTTRPAWSPAAWHATRSCCGWCVAPAAPGWTCAA